MRHGGKFVDVKTCTWGNPAPQARTAAIIGDSMSMTYVNPLRIVLSKQGQPWRITTLAHLGVRSAMFLPGHRA